MESSEKKNVSWLPILTGLAAGIFLLQLVFVISVLRLGHTLNQYEKRLDAVLTRVETITKDLEELDVEGIVTTVNGLAQDLDRVEIRETVHSLHEISDQLSRVEWVTLSEDVSAAAQQAKESLAGMEETLSEMESAVAKMDIDGLNKAVKDMKDAIAPLAALNNAMFKLG